MTKTIEQKKQEVIKQLVAPMEKIERKNLDNDLIHDVALFAQNTENLLFPTLKSIQKKYKQGKYDHTLALLAWHHVAKEALKIYAKKFYYPPTWIKTINKFHIIAIAEELREYVEYHNYHKQQW